jgi:hypothetical protein
MILYAVTVNIEADIEKDWLQWMKEVHIPDLMRTGLFESYRIFRILTRQEDESGVSYSMQNFMHSMEDFERYQKEFAPTLRKEYDERYKNKFVAFRTLLEEV